MELATIARPYAEALFRVAQKDDLTKWATIVSELATIGADPELRDLANHPKLDKVQFVDLLLSLLSSSQQAEVRNFLELLVRNDRIVLLPEIAEQFHDLKNLSEGTADAEIISAYPMSESQLHEVLQTLEKRFMRKLNVTVTEDTSLIGGIVVIVGDEMLDLSVRAKLQRMQEALIV